MLKNHSFLSNKMKSSQFTFLTYKDSIILVVFTICIIGGLMGLTFVFLLTKVLSGALDFPVYISTSNLVLAIGICVLVGVIAGFIPARQAARMDPVVAIRSK